MLTDIFQRSSRAPGPWSKTLTFGTCLLSCRGVLLLLPSKWTHFNCRGEKNVFFSVCTLEMLELSSQILCLAELSECSNLHPNVHIPPPQPDQACISGLWAGGRHTQDFSGNSAGVSVWSLSWQEGLSSRSRVSSQSPWRTPAQHPEGWRITKAEVLLFASWARSMPRTLPCLLDCAFTGREMHVGLMSVTHCKSAACCGVEKPLCNFRARMQSPSPQYEV